MWDSLLQGGGNSSIKSFRRRRKRFQCPYLLPIQWPQPQNEEILLAMEETEFEEKISHSLPVIGKPVVDNHQEEDDNEADDDDAEESDEEEFEQ
ncbi:hypothetical protein Bca4012_027394 [Brassica carinata]